ncbi:hypothetical protein HMPREF3198_00030 [Winkia neuii]|nr:hypothetical protein HMPREF3198_00030 [Winkia neuii]
MLRPRTQAKILRFISVLSPVLSGSTRTTRPSLTWRRSGQREPQLTTQAEDTVRSTSVRPVPLATSLPWPGWEYFTFPFEQATSPALAPAMADHFKNERRVGPEVDFKSFTATSSILLTAVH